MFKETVALELTRRQNSFSIDYNENLKIISQYRVFRIKISLIRT